MQINLVRITKIMRETLLSKRESFYISHLERGEIFIIVLSQDDQNILRRNFYENEKIA